MTDIFGFTKSGDPFGQVLSSEFASINVGGKLALAQSVEASYAQQINEISNIGDSMIYWLPGKPKGSINITKLVGAGGFLKAFGIGACGRMNGISITGEGGACSAAGGGTVSFDGAIAESVSIRINAQDLSVAESVNVKVASMSA